jgi:hypothetical protein
LTLTIADVNYFCRWAVFLLNPSSKGLAVAFLDSMPGRPRWSLACLAIALAVSVLPGCARAVEGTPVGPSGPVSQSSSPTGKNAPAQPVRDYDISKLSRVQDEFPSGFRHIRATPVATLGPGTDRFFNIGFGDVVAIDPPNCQSVLQPVRPSRGDQFIVVTGFGVGAIMVGAVKSHQPLPGITAPAGCDHVALTQKKAGRKFDSTVTSVRRPSIDGVITTGSVDRSKLGGTSSYIFAGSVSSTVAVVVEGLIPGDSQAEDALRELLIKAVNAIRAD